MVRLILFSVVALIIASIAFFLARDVGEQYDPEAIRQAKLEAAYEDVLKSAQGGDLKAAARLGDLLRLGRGVERDPRAALRWYTAAAKGGHVGAQYMLGRMYETGDGVPLDYARAADWYHRAADLGADREARYRLAGLYFDGRGVTNDFDKAIKLYRAAAGQGHPAAQYLLGVMREDGWGMTQDLVLAYKWLTLAARRPDVVLSYDSKFDVRKALDKLRAKMNGFQIQRGDEAVRAWRPAREIAPSGEVGR